MAPRIQSRSAGLRRAWTCAGWVQRDASGGDWDPAIVSTFPRLSWASASGNNTGRVQNARKYVVDVHIGWFLVMFPNTLQSYKKNMRISRNYLEKFGTTRFSSKNSITFVTWFTNGAESSAQTGCFRMDYKREAADRCRLSQQQNSNQKKLKERKSLWQ